MEDLGLGELGSLGSSGDLSGSLADYLQGLGDGLGQNFLTGDLDALAAPMELPAFAQAPAEPLPAKTEELPSCSGAALMSQAETTDNEDEAHGRGGPKRRRRTRTERQQQLNRLAQQRYRQRKKEKVQALQSTVGTLQTQLDRLSLLERENAQLRASTASLGEQLAAKDCQLQAAHQQLRHTAAQLKSQADKAAAQERLIAEQQSALEARRAPTPHLWQGVDPQALSDRLLAIIKEAFADVQAQGPSGSGVTSSSGGQAPSAGGQAQGAAAGGASAAGLAPAALLDEALAARISRALTSCCRELVYANAGIKGKQGAAAAAAAEAPSAIPVSCC